MKKTGLLLASVAIVVMVLVLIVVLLDSGIGKKFWGPNPTQRSATIIAQQGEPTPNPDGEQDPWGPGSTSDCVQPIESDGEPTPEPNDDADALAGAICWDYWLTYSANGGNGGTTEHLSGGEPFHSYTIIGPTRTYQSDNGPYEKVIVSRDGYTFKCWNTEPDGSGKTFYPGQEVFSMSEIGTTLYAIWEAE